MPRLSCAEFARRAGVSRQAVHDAVKHYALVRDEDGLIDTECGPNRSYLEFHVHGVDRNLRDMRTYGRPIGSTARERVPAEDGDGAGLDSPDEVMPGAFTDAEIDAILAEGDVMAVLKEMREEQREALRRIGERLDELNLRLSIARDPFQAMTVAGSRLMAKDEAERKSSAAAAGGRFTEREP